MCIGLGDPRCWGRRPFAPSHVADHQSISDVFEIVTAGHGEFRSEPGLAGARNGYGRRSRKDKDPLPRGLRSEIGM